MIVRDWMNESPVWVGPATSLGRACELAAQNRLRALPVVDPDRFLLGVVTWRDLLAVALGEEAALDQAVTTVMTALPRKVTPDDSIDAATLQFCLDPEVDALPVVEQGRLLGLLERSHALWALATHRHAEGGPTPGAGPPVARRRGPTGPRQGPPAAESPGTATRPSARRAGGAGGSRGGEETHASGAGGWS